MIDSELRIEKALRCEFSFGDLNDDEIEIYFDKFAETLGGISTPEREKRFQSYISEN